MKNKKSFNALSCLFSCSIVLTVLFYNSCKTQFERNFVLIGAVGFVLVSIPSVLSFVSKLALDSVKKPTRVRDKTNYIECKILEDVKLPGETKSISKTSKISTKKEGGNIPVAERGKGTSVEAYVRKHTKKTIEDEEYQNLRNYIISSFKNKQFRRETIVMLKRHIDNMLGDNITHYSRFKFDNDAQEIYIKIKNSSFTKDHWINLLDYTKALIEPGEEVS